MRGEEEEAGRPGWTGNLCGSCRVFSSNPIPFHQERTQEPSSLPGFFPEATLESISWQLGPAMVVKSLRSEVHLSLTLHAVTQPWQLPQKTTSVALSQSAFLQPTSFKTNVVTVSRPQPLPQISVSPVSREDQPSFMSFSTTVIQPRILGQQLPGNKLLLPPQVSWLLLQQGAVSLKPYGEYNQIFEVWILALLFFSMSVGYLESWTVEGILGLWLQQKILLDWQRRKKVHWKCPFKLVSLLFSRLLLGLVTWVSSGLLAGAWVGTIYRCEGTSQVSGYTTGKAPLSLSPLIPWTAYKSSEKCGWDFLTPSHSVIGG